MTFRVFGNKGLYLLELISIVLCLLVSRFENEKITLVSISLCFAITTLLSPIPSLYAAIFFLPLLAKLGQEDTRIIWVISMLSWGVVDICGGLLIDRKSTRLNSSHAN